MQAIQFLSLALVAITVDGGTVSLEERNVALDISADVRSKDPSYENGGYEGYARDGYTSNNGKGGNSNNGMGGSSNNGHKNSVSTYCEIQSTNESTLKQAKLGVKLIFDGIRQTLKSSGGNRDKSTAQDELKGRAYNAFKNAIVWTIRVAAKIRSDKSSQYQSNIDAALDDLDQVLRYIFDAMKLPYGKNKRDIPDEIQRCEDGATQFAVAVISEIYGAISRPAKGDSRLESSTGMYLKKSTKFIQRCISFFFLGIRKLSSAVNPDVKFEDCDSCSTSTIDDAEIRSTNAMEIQLNTQFEALFAVCSERCSDGSGCGSEQCSQRTDTRSVGIS